MKQLTIKDLNIQLGKSFINPEIYCHPDNYDILLKSLHKESGEFFYMPIHIDYEYLYGIKIHQDHHLPRFVRAWKFPADQFINYGKEDESWAIPLEFGSYQDTTEPAFFIIDKIRINYSYENIFKPNYAYKSLLSCF